MTTRANNLASIEPVDIANVCNPAMLSRALRTIADNVERVNAAPGLFDANGLLNISADGTVTLRPDLTVKFDTAEIKYLLDPYGRRFYPFWFFARWAKTNDDSQDADSGTTGHPFPYVPANPCDDAYGNGVNTSVTLYLALPPWNPHYTHGVKSGYVVPYFQSASSGSAVSKPVYVIGSDYSEADYTGGDPPPWLVPPMAKGTLNSDMAPGGGDPSVTFSNFIGIAAGYTNSTYSTAGWTNTRHSGRSGDVVIGVLHYVSETPKWDVIDVTLHEESFYYTLDDDAANNRIRFTRRQNYTESTTQDTNDDIDTTDCASGS